MQNQNKNTKEITSFTKARKKRFNMAECKIGNIAIHVEILGLLLFLSTSIEDSVTTNLIIYKTCYITLNFNQSECALLGTQSANNFTADMEEIVQPHANIILMTRSVFESSITVILCFFLGTWSDMYGRKPIFLSVFAGYTLWYITMIFVSSIPNLSPWFVLLRTIPYVLSGGYPILFASLLSYITDVTSEEIRGTRMGIYEALLGLSMIIGSSVSSYIFNSYGYPIVYTVSAACTIAAWIFTFFLVPESVRNVNKEGKFKNLFQFSLATETIKLTFRRRQNNLRAIILLSIFIVIVFMLATFGTASLMFLYLREKFHWSLKQYTLYNSFNFSVILIGSVCGPYILHKVLHFREIIVIFLGELSAMLSAIFLSVANESWQVYVATGIKCLGGAVNPMIHCLLSKLVPSEDTCKIFSLITALQTITTFVIGAPLYTFIYNNTLTTFPSAFIFVTIIMYCFELVAIGMIYRLQKPHILYE